MTKTYLGDGIYAESKDGQFILTTSNGEEDTNVIYFGDNEVLALMKVLTKLQEEWAVGL